MTWLIIHAVIGTVYSLMKVGKLDEMLHDPDWVEILEDVLCSRSTWKMMFILSVFWPLGLGLDLYQKQILDDDDLKPKKKTGRKKAPAKKKR